MEKLWIVVQTGSYHQKHSNRDRSGKLLSRKENIQSRFSRFKSRIKVGSTDVGVD